MYVLPGVWCVNCGLARCLVQHGCGATQNKRAPTSASSKRRWTSSWQTLTLRSRCVAGRVLPGLFLLVCEALTTHVEQSKHQARAGAAKTDADGFTLVTGKRRRRMGDTDDVGGLTSSATGEKRRRKKGPMELSNFYRFQVRESKRDRRWPLVPRCAMVGDSRACRIVPELALLRAKFEEDKERIRRLQASRPFRPHR